MNYFTQFTKCGLISSHSRLACLLQLTNTRELISQWTAKTRCKSEQKKQSISGRFQFDPANDSDGCDRYRCKSWNNRDREGAGSHETLKLGTPVREFPGSR